MGACGVPRQRRPGYPLRQHRISSCPGLTLFPLSFFPFPKASEWAEGADAPDFPMPKMRTTPVEFDFESIVRGVASDLALSSKELLKKWPAASKEVLSREKYGQHKSGD